MMPAALAVSHIHNRNPQLNPNLFLQGLLGGPERTNLGAVLAVLAEAFLEEQ